MTFRYKVEYRNIPNFMERRVEVIQWCKDNLGAENINLTWTSYAWKMRFRFKKDYVLFLLRWT